MDTLQPDLESDSATANPMPEAGQQSQLAMFILDFGEEVVFNLPPPVIMATLDVDMMDEVLAFEQTAVTIIQSMYISQSAGRRV
jgi:hypothetical protein